MVPYQVFSQTARPRWKELMKVWEMKKKVTIRELEEEKSKAK